MSGLILSGIIIILVLVFVGKGLMIVKQAEVVLVERLGKYNRMLTSGVNI
ncbi:MAG TPA: SPFH/Band 7/PHB domain protein, partial [Bacteroidetes bacterium]|nr:SPFH/Band 7/PHB domain protein [Bacteroidota bacterium]